MRIITRILEASVDEVEHLMHKKNFFGDVLSPTRVSGQHLAFLFGISQSTVSRIFIPCLNFMYLCFGTINIWPTCDEIDKTMPEDFKAKYPKTRVILDCTELKCQMPSSLLLSGCPANSGPVNFGSEKS